MSYYKIQNFEQYFKHYKSVREPRKFLGKIAEENFTWYQLWDKVVEFDMAEAEINGLPKQKLT
jgi:acetyl-CoA synthetase